MRLLVDRAETCRADMRIDLRRHEALVSEQLLNATDIGTSVEQVSGETVPQCMGCGAGIESCYFEVFFEHSRNAASR